MPVLITPSSRSSLFPCLIGVAFAIAFLGLLANLWHLQTLTNARGNSLFFHHDQHDAPWHIDEEQQSSTRQQEELLSIQDHIWKEVLQQTVSNFESCPLTHPNPQLAKQQSGDANITTTTKSINPQSLRLPQFGLINNLNQQIMKHMMMSSTTSTSEICRVPPSTSCTADNDSYTLVIPFTIPNKRIKLTTPLRHLFLNTLSCLSNPSTTQILIVMLSSPSSSGDNSTATDDSYNMEEKIRRDAKYGQRLWAWHTDETHPVRLQFCERHQLLTSHCISNLTTSALVWWNIQTAGATTISNNLNSATHYDATSFQVAWELWKRHSDSIIVPSNHAGYQLLARNNEAPSSSNNSAVFSLQPVCVPPQQLVRRPKKTTQDWNILNLRNGGGMILFHSHHLCWYQTLWKAIYIDHGDNDPISWTEDEFWFQTSLLFTMSALFVTSTTSSAPLDNKSNTTTTTTDTIRFFPSHIRTNTDNEDSPDDNIEKDEKHEKNTNNDEASLSTDNSTIVLSRVLLANSDEEESTELGTTVVTGRRRRLSEETQTDNPDEDSFLYSLVGFMGSLPVRKTPPPDCLFCNNNKTRKAIPLSQIPWMNTPCSEHSKP